MKHVPNVRVIDNVFLQTQVDTLYWQLRQIEGNRLMYRSLMEQVVRFLSRAHKSLCILTGKSKTKDKGSNGRVPRSRSVHTVADTSINGNASGSSTSNIAKADTSSTSRFSRAKSVTQISSGSTSFRDFTLSLLRRNDSNSTKSSTSTKSSKSFKLTGNKKSSKKLSEVEKTKNQIPKSNRPSSSEQSSAEQPKIEQPEADQSSSKSCSESLQLAYQTPPKQQELDPNEIPPEKLAREAYRLMRSVQSLLSMKELDLIRVTPIEENPSTPSPVMAVEQIAESPENASFVNSTSNRDVVVIEMNDSNVEPIPDNGFTKSTNVDTGAIQHHESPRTRRSIDSGSSKTTTEEEDASAVNPSGTSRADREVFATPTSTPKSRLPGRNKKQPKPANSVSSAEDESGFSSMNSFQEVGLPLGPNGLPFSPIKGSHTEVGLPEVPLEKVRHRRWSSTPSDIKAMFNRRHSTSLCQKNGVIVPNSNGTDKTTKSVSVWV